ncbi:MAG: phosphoglucomutase/phosphomannomutase family protein [Candidatus Omnitrophica bacterium]|nr:phosphoglucomutase/phosphomannomutase family protein [Candidatus Omnitrophota bacterium]MDD5310922.1 phosphoglucomutase/phosphomannomutase family protein [Candidatus Omnitrophota bacterium]
MKKAEESKIKFGTDGWRGLIAEDFTFENVRIVAQACADHFNKEFKAPRRIIIGYDTRFISDKFARAVAEVLAANGIKTYLSDRPSPTPTTSYNIRLLGLNGGLIITASHNPGRFSGLKIKTPFGSPADQTVTHKVEAFLYKNKVKTVSLEEAVRTKKVEVINPMPKYLDAVRKYLDLDLLKNCGLKVVAEAMHGAGNSYHAAVLKGTKVKIDTINAEPNPSFEGLKPEPLPHNMPKLMEIMKRGRYDIGLATDGDADRVGAVAPGGRFINPGEIMCLIALHFIENRRWRGALVKNIAGPMLMNKIAKYYNLKFFETPVGFKHIAKLMQRENVLVGGEESGGIGVKNYIPERDGILTGLLLVEMMQQEKKPILELIENMEKKFGKFRYHRQDVEIPLKTREKVVKVLFSKLQGEVPHQRGKSSEKIFKRKIVDIKTYDGLKFIFDDESWLLIRPSGTEPILRVYSEAHTDKEAKDLIAIVDRMSKTIK